MSTPKPGQGFIVSNWTAVDIGVYDTADSVVMTFYFLLVLVLGLWVWTEPGVAAWVCPLPRCTPRAIPALRSPSSCPTRSLA